MNFNEYQEKAASTAIYPDKYRIIYPALGLAGETGETCEKIKKLIRDHDFDPEIYLYCNIDGLEKFWEEKRTEVKKEIGDIIWYVANLAKDFGLKLDDIAQENIEKLRDRKNRGVLNGSGDNR